MFNSLKTKTRILLALFLCSVVSCSLFGQTKTLKFLPGDSLEVIRAKIKHNGYKFKVEENWVTRLTPEQKKKMFVVKKRSNYSTLKTGSGPLVYHFNKKLDSSFDWRNINGASYIGSPRNQGSEGTCYAFGACAAAETAYNFGEGKKDSDCVDFSESYIAWCLGTLGSYNSHFFGGGGADYDYYELAALTKAQGFYPNYDGCAYEEDCPYSETEINASDYLGKVTTVLFQSWHRVYPANFNDTTEQIKIAISTYGTVDAAVYASSAFQAYSSGVYEDSNTSPTESPYYYETVNHAISLVGWDDNPSDGGGGCWILRNSWGSSWGESGYMRIRYKSAAVNCAASYLVYQPSTATLTMQSSPSSYGSTTPSGESTVNTGEAQTITAIPESGYSFSEWTYVGQATIADSTSATTTVTLDSSATITANFVEKNSSITVLTPNGGESWILGSSNNITWTSTDVDGNINIKLYKGDNLSLDIATVENTGNYLWQIPDTVAVGEDYTITVTSVDETSVTDSSDSTFSIVEGDTAQWIQVTYPNGGEQWTIGSEYSVIWDSNNIEGSVCVQFLKGGTAVYTEEVANTGKLEFTVPNTFTPGSDYLVKVYSSLFTNIYDVSNNNMTIKEHSDDDDTEVISLSTQTIQTSMNIGASGELASFDISNGSSGTLNYNLKPAVSWLECSVYSGSVTNGSETVTINCNTENLAPGTYSGAIVVSANASNSPQNVNVILTVKPEGSYSVTIDSEFNIYSAGVDGIDEFTKKPNVYVTAGAKKYRIKVLNSRQQFKLGLETIRCRVASKIPEGNYQLVVVTKKPKLTCVYSDEFTVTAPIIDSKSCVFMPETGSKTATATTDMSVQLVGKYFSNKPKVYFEYINSRGRRKKARIKLYNCNMNVLTGESNCYGIGHIPKGVEGQLVLKNKVGEASLSVDAQ